MRGEGYSLPQTVDGANIFTASQLFASQDELRAAAAGTNGKRVNTCANSPNLPCRNIVYRNEQLELCREPMCGGHTLGVVARVESNG
jgi:hypothetical protein